jgi:hypothetical protein
VIRTFIEDIPSLAKNAVVAPATGVTVVRADPSALSGE